ncbi:MAG: hemolysin III family protein [Gemmataceae bacterium]|nr:hemolysin III family protein [Gemmataceae bacterium]MDW8265162.1 hemolysin III family protein [Gemmataceae bacterium]
MHGLEFREPVSTWTHLVWMLLSLPATAWLWSGSRGDRPKQISLLVFGVSLFLCFAGSSLYHGVCLPPDWVDFFEMLDFIGIYLLIAGSCTPIAFTLLRGRWRWGILALAWSFASVGILLRLALGQVSPWVYNSLYLAMGWGLVSCYFELARAVSHRALLLVLVGGVLYTIGALLNAVSWPALWPGVFMAHELFHVLVMAGSACHFFFMLRWVVPYPRQAADLAAEAATGWDSSVSSGPISG